MKSSFRHSAAAGLGLFLTPLIVHLAAPMASAQAEPKTVAELTDRGLSLFKEKNYNAAITDFTRAIQLDPNSAKLYAYRAESWGAKHNRDQEIADLNQAIRLEPRNTQYLLSRAGAWSSQGRHDEAMADYNAAIRLEPNNPAPYVARGNEWRRHIKLGLALADYDRAIQIDPNYTHAYISRALISRQRRDFARAVAELTAIARMAPDDAEVHRLLARILATCTNESVRDGNRAVHEAIRACELTNWHDPDSIDTLAAAYAEVGDYPLAVQWQTKAIDLVRHDTPSTLQRAMNFNGRRGVGFEDRLAFYKRKRPTRE
jgi:tetratricopeptide (TPR) repeat protein